MPEDIEWVTMDDDLVNFLTVGDKSLAPNDQPYFQEDKFNMQTDPYNPIASNSENELYLIRFGRRKAKA
ncbi:hypothetical protein EV426DRAFT_704579 [Tirmania nivea]|nr:hypothetical protein EV426DRAFT_704579 [Tirmania nivea]